MGEWGEWEVSFYTEIKIKGKKFFLHYPKIRKIY